MLRQSKSIEDQTEAPRLEAPTTDLVAKSQSSAGVWTRIKSEADRRFDWSQRWYRFRRWIPAIAFFTGFLIDAINLGIGVKFLDLVVVSSYAVVGFVFLIARPKASASPKWSRWVTNGQQFALGALFSAMVVLYFKSSGQFWSFVFVLGLFGVQVGNEFLHRDDRQTQLVWAVQTVSVVMLLNFLIPHWTHSVSSWWFYASTLLGVAVMLLARWITCESWKNLRVAAGAVGVLVVLFFLGAIPPVPLVLKNQLACVDFEKSDYSCATDKPSVLQLMGLGHKTVTRHKKAVYALTSVFAPKDIEVKLQHAWYRDTQDGWKLVDTMNFSMRGGRKEGWRVWSRKRNAAAGLWRVETRLKDGAVLGFDQFEVVQGPDDAPRVRTKLAPKASKD